MKSGPLNVGILFVDLVDSSVFAGVLGLREYAVFMRSFHDACLLQCQHFFGTFLEGKYASGCEYAVQLRGDELLVFTHTGKGANDVYMLACLAATLKAAWLGSPFNVERIGNRLPAVEISAGIHHGPVWVEWRGSEYDYCGYAINLAKRVEGISRRGVGYRIFLTDQAFKQVNFRQRNLLFSDRQQAELKGILGQAGVYELAHTFMNPEPRLHPPFVQSVTEVFAEAIMIASQEAWIHDLFQVWSEAKHGKVTDEAMIMCRQVISHSPGDPVALYHLAQGLREKGDHAAAILLLREVTSAWPQFGDGFYELGKLLEVEGNTEAALAALRRADLLGVENALPPSVQVS